MFQYERDIPLEGVPKVENQMPVTDKKEAVTEMTPYDYRKPIPFEKE